MKVVGLSLMVIHSFIIFHIFHDQFLFIINLICQSTMGSHDVMGGITLAPLIVIIIFILFKGRLFIKDKVVGFLLLILIITNFMGYLFNSPADTKDLIQSMLIFSGFILTFIFIQSYSFTESNIKSFFQVLTFISVVLFVVALNQKFVFIDSSFFLLGRVPGYSSVSSVSIDYDGRYPSLFCDYELFSEFALLTFILAFSVFMDRDSSKRFGGGTSMLLMSLSFLNVLITGTRSGFILLFVFIILFFLIRSGTLLSNKAFLLFSVLVVLVLVIMFFGDLLGFELIIERLREIDVKRLSVNNLVTGEQLNRSLVYAEGYKRIGEENWILGYGYGTSAVNSYAWLGNIGSLGFEIRDFHSLYLCIPMIYGWIGGIAYLLIILYVIIKNFRVYLLMQAKPIRGLILGFAFVFMFFLLNELKINSLRTYNYHFLIWILLGIAISLSNQPSKST